MACQMKGFALSWIKAHLQKNILAGVSYPYNNEYNLVGDIRIVQ